MGKFIKVRWQNWVGDSAEDLILRETEEDILATSVITSWGKESYTATYSIACDHSWRTRKCEIELTEKQKRLRLELDGSGKWLQESCNMAELNGAIDVDISATPFTNTLPILRLRLKENQSDEISVAYVSVPELSVSLKRQRYTCLIPGKLYRFEQFDISFIREIDIDENGLVLVYPGLFKRRL
jgi:uncharacterized protein